MTRALSFLLALLASGALASGADAQTCTTSWASATGGSWTDAARWTSGVPGAADTACITEPGTYTVTGPTTAVSVNRLVVGGASGTQTFLLRGSLSLGSDGTIRANGELEWATNYLESGTLTNEGLVRLTTATASRGARGAGTLFRNEGTVEFESTGRFYVYGGARAENAGLWRIADGGDFYGFTGEGTFVNTGTLRKQGAALAQFTGGALAFENTGVIDVQGGELRFERPSRHTSGDFAVASGAQLVLNAESYFAGRTTGSPEGALRIASTFSTAEGAVWDVGGAGVEWTTNYLESGTLTNEGLVRLTGASGSRGVNGEGTIFRNEGTVAHEGTGRFYSYGGARIENASLWRIADSGDLYGFTGAGVFVNEANATLRKQGNGLSQVVGGALTLENDGLIDVAAGELRFDRPSVHTDARLEVASDALLVFSAGGVRFEGSLTGTPTGTLRLQDSFDVVDAVWNVNGSGVEWSTNYMESGTLINEGLVRLTTTTGSRGARGAGTLFRNTGTVEFESTGRFYVNGGARAENASLWRIADGGDLYGFTGAGTFVNTGTLRKQGDGLAQVVGGALAFENTGEIDVQGGELQFQVSSSHTNASFAVAADALIVFAAPHVTAGRTTGTPEGGFRISSSFSAVEGAVWDVGGTGVEWSADYMESGTLTNEGLVRLTTTTGSRGARGAGTLFRNEGTVEFESTGRFYVYGGARAENAALWRIADGGDLYGFTGAGTFVNTGTLRKSGEALAQVVGGALAFENTGVIDVQGGELRFERPSTHVNTRIDVASGALAVFSTGGVRFRGTLSGTAAGALRIRNAFEADNATWNVGGTGIEWETDYFEDGTLTNRGLVRLTGTSGSRGARGDATRFRNEGTVEFESAGRFYVYGGARAENASLWRIADGGDFYGFTGTGTFVNTGTLRKGGEGLAQIVGGALVFDNRGTFDVQEGEVRVQRPFTHQEDAVIRGNGTFSVQTNAFVHNGDTRPGSPTGNLVWGGTFAPSDEAELQIEIGGTDPGTGYDQLLVTGAAQANGRLVVDLLGSYTPTTGDTFTILTASNLTGGFELEGLVNTAADVAFYPAISQTALTLTASNGIPTISGTLAVSPSKAVSDQTIEVTITGTGFAPDATVELVCDQCLEPNTYGVVAGRIQSLSPTEMVAVFALDFNVVGVYDVVVTDPRGGEARTPFTITPGDLTVSVEAVDPVGREEGANRASFVVRSNARNITPLDVRFDLSGTATRFVDYATNVTRRTVRIPAGQTSARVVIVPLADNETEGDETVILSLVSEDDEYIIGTPGAATTTIADGPPATTFSLLTSQPRRGGAGSVTLQISGSNIAQGASARLTCAGASYDAGLAAANSQGTSLSAQFDLRGQDPALCDVAVASGGNTETLGGAFRVVAARAPDLSVELISPERRRRGRQVRHRIIVTNDGNTDAYLVPIEISVNASAVINPEFPVENPPMVPDFPAIPGEFPGYGSIPVQVEIDGRQLLSIVVPVVPAGGEVELTFMSDASLVSASVLTPFIVDFVPGDAVATFSPEFEADLLSGIEGQGIDGDVALCWTRKLGFAVASALGSRVTGVAGCISALATTAAVFANQAIAAFSTGDTSVLSYQRMLTTYTGAIINCLNAAGASLPWSAPIAIAINVASASYDAYYECPKKPKETETEEVTSFDPNDKLGPVGVEDARYVRGDEGRVYYTIRFENLATATAPAAEVFVTDTLDVSVFDPESFRLSNVTFGERTVEVPPGLSSWTGSVDLQPEMPILLQISGSIDEDGLISWAFVSLDPQTLDLPDDPLVGFLPPNQTAPEGEGSVSFSVALRPGLTDGTEIANDARIVFDLNEPIDTPVWSNTVDRAAPTSSVLAVNNTAVSDTTLSLSLQGSDGGSGVLNYEIYASRDGGPFELAFTADTTSPLFEAERGSIYSFFSIARDRVNNMEGPKTEAEATTPWPVDTETPDPDLPTELTLASPYPNPTQSAAVAQFGLPTSTQVDLRVFDVQGREVARIAEGEHAAGWHRVTWNTGSVASGVYVILLRSEGRTLSQRVTVVR